MPDHYMSGIVYDKGDFWVSRYYPDPGHLYKVNDSGTVLHQFDGPDDQPWDLTIENGNIWIADYWGDTLYCVDPKTGSVIQSNASEGIDPAGIVWDGQYLWYCDNGDNWDEDILYKVDLQGGGSPEISITDSSHAFGNVAIGDVMLSDSRNCLVRGESRLVACAGIENVVVTETADAVLVAGLDADAGIRDIVERLRAAGRPEAVRHLAEDRPWGSFRVLMEGPRFKIKEIVVKPGGILSLQSHRRRSEHWVVVDGSARVTRDDTVEMLGPNESSYIPIGARHRLENPGETPLRIVEVQCGDYLGEDDIERYEDSYGRE